MQNNVSKIFEKYYDAKNYLNKTDLPILVQKLRELLDLIIENQNSNQNPNILKLVKNLVSQCRWYLAESENLKEILLRILETIGISGTSEIIPTKALYQNPPQNIHIGVMYHKNFELFMNECLFPIHLGKACSDYKLGICGDDFGDNISIKNPAYAELTGLYWIWKNVKADIKGIMHYRRFLDLKNFSGQHSIYSENIGSGFVANRFLERNGLSQKNISKLMQKYDLIVRREDDFGYWEDFSIASHYKNHHLIEHVDIALQIIKDDYPEMLASVVSTFAGTKNYFNNIFIMKSEVFDNYCTWLFDVLEKIEKRINPYDINLAPETVNTRWAGYLGERLTGAYIRKLIQDGASYRDCSLKMLNETNQGWNNADTYSKESLNYLSNESIISDEVLVSVITKSPSPRIVQAIQGQSIKNIEIIIFDETDKVKILYNGRLNIFPLNGLKSILEICNGKFVHFMNEKDFIEKNFYKNILINAINNESDIVISTYRNVNPKNISCNKTSLLPATLYGKNLNVKDNIDLLMDNFEIFSKLFSREFLLNNSDILEIKNPVLFTIKSILRAKKISILRDSQYKHMFCKENHDNLKNTEICLELLNEIDKISEKQDKNIRESLQLFRNRVLYGIICKNISSFAENSSISDLILNYIANTKLQRISANNEKKLSFYCYRREFMNKILKLKNKDSIKKEVLNSLIDLTLDFNEIDIEYLFKEEIV